MHNVVPAGSPGRCGFCETRSRRADGLPPGSGSPSVSTSPWTMTPRGARHRIGAALNKLYGYFGLQDLEAPAVFGPPEACVKGLRKGALDLGRHSIGQDNGTDADEYVQEPDHPVSATDHRVPLRESEEQDQNAPAPGKGNGTRARIARPASAHNISTNTTPRSTCWAFPPKKSSPKTSKVAQVVRRSSWSAAIVAVISQFASSPRVGNAEFAAFRVCPAHATAVIAGNRIAWKGVPPRDEVQSGSFAR
jgi:hypothetical protein